MKKKFYIIIFLFSFIYISTTFAIEENKKDLYKTYKKNIEKHCLDSSFYNKNNFVYKYKESEFQKYYPNVEELKNNSQVKYLLNWNKWYFAINTIKEKYRYIQNEIYKCWLIAAQYNWINIIIANSQLDKTWNLKTIIEKKFKPIKNRLKNQFKNCNLKNNLKISKKQILDQSTFELCKYSFYLDYLYDYYDNTEHILGIDNKENLNKTLNNLEYNPELISSIQKNIKQQIVNEKKHSYEIFPIAFTAYSEYQSYYPIHLALELLKDNLILYREKLYKALSPINQVVYKIINAMSK